MTGRTIKTWLPVLTIMAAAGVALGEEPAAVPPVPRCEIAVVSPVTGSAECVKPRGAPVDPPPPRPPLSAEQCAQHADLALKECQRSEAPQPPGG